MLYFLTSVWFIARVTTATVDSAELRREELMAALRAGGYTVVLRHARTDRSFKEEMGYVPKERSAQRNLTDDGIRDAALMGVVFRKHRIAFAEILASPMYRTVETAELAAGPPATTMVLRTFPSTAEQAALVATPPRPGTNRLIVTHHFVIETHVPGIRPGDIAESEAVVVRHLSDGKVQLVGRILLDDWRALANPGATTATSSPGAASPAVSHGGTAGSHSFPARTASGGADTGIPDTHVGHVAREYLAAFNSGSPEQMRAFFGSWMVADSSRPVNQRLETYAKLFADLGPLDTESVQASGATELILVTRSKRGSVRLTVTTSEAQPMRATSVRFAFTEGAHR